MLKSNEKHETIQVYFYYFSKFLLLFKQLLFEYIGLSPNLKPCLMTVGNNC